MIRILFGMLAVALVGAATARAADKPVSAYKVRPVAQQQSWEGLYLGAHLGYGWGRTRVIDNGVLTEAGAPTNGVIGGGLIGYNWQRERLVFGLEADFGAANLRGVGEGEIFIPPPPPPPPTPPNGYAVDWTGNLRARFGYLLWPQTLIFAAGGFSFADFNYTHGASGNSFVGIRPGWTIGGGIDHLLLANLILRLEYLYANYGNRTYEVLPGDFYSAAFKSQTFRGAAIWKFPP